MLPTWAPAYRMKASLPLRSRLALVVLVAALPLIALVVVNSANHARLESEQAADEALHSARAVAERTAQRLQRARAVLAWLAQRPSVNQEVTRELLERAGLVADVVDDGAQAVERVRNGHYALVLMDMQMPQIGGLEATRAIRARGGHATLPTLAMMANAFDEDRERCLAAGVNDRVSKPVSPRRFYASVLHWLEQAEPGPRADD